jgi:hypothetical protein
MAGTASAASNDEIQVYDDSINKPGEFGLDLHMNYVVSGIKTPEWPGDAPANHSARLTPEFSYGLTETWELGAYLPLLRVADGTTYIEGAKARIKYLSAPEGEAFYWGLNEEVGRVSFRSAEANWNLEIRPILGYRISRWNLSVNPIVDMALSGPDKGIPDFSPAFRASYALRQGLRLGIEHYTELGRLDDLSPYGQETRVTYAVVDAAVGEYDVNFGAGRGWNTASDKWTVKSIVSARF